MKIVDASGEKALLWQNSKTILNSNIHVANQSSQILSFWDPHYLFSDLYFSPQTPEEKPCPIIEPKNYVSPENSTFSSLKPLTVSLSWSFLLKRMLSPTLQVFERRREQSGLWVVSSHTMRSWLWVLSPLGQVPSVPFGTSQRLVFFFCFFLTLRCGSFQPKACERNSSSTFIIVVRLSSDSSAIL